MIPIAVISVAVSHHSRRLQCHSEQVEVAHRLKFLNRSRWLRRSLLRFRDAVLLSQFLWKIIIMTMMISKCGLAEASQCQKYSHESNPSQNRSWPQAISADHRINAVACSSHGCFSMSKICKFDDNLWWTQYLIQLILNLIILIN